ncbi:MAG: hypothetical protein ACKOZU_08775 [Planctomycetaceae bacterium]
MIATPTIDGRLDHRYVLALLASIQMFRELGWRYALAFEVGNSLLADARNKLVFQCLADDYTDLVFIDSDMAWDPADLVALLSYDVPLVAAAGPRRNPGAPEFCVKLGQAVMGPDGLLSVERVGTGFMRLRRDCLESLVEAHPDLCVTDAAGRRSHALFDAGMQNGTYISEDYMFCDRWRAIGGKVLVAPGIRLQHVGTHVWHGALADVLTVRRTV